MKHHEVRIRINGRTTATEFFALDCYFPRQELGPVIEYLCRIGFRVPSKPSRKPRVITQLVGVSTGGSEYRPQVGKPVTTTSAPRKPRAKKAVTRKSKAT
jgi:hypothetical protein